MIYVDYGLKRFRLLVAGPIGVSFSFSQKLTAANRKQGLGKALGKH
jgi:hypothetical protein